MTRTRPNGSSGFTLIELMVVVGIIGILVTVAVPQFRKYLSRARQTEAKLALGAGLTAERSFYAENNVFIGCINAIGISPPSSPFYYTFGFQYVDLGNQNMIVSAGPVSCTSTHTTNVHYYLANTFVPGSAVSPADNQFGGVGVHQAYGSLYMGASGKISRTTSVEDVWTINHLGQLINEKANL